MGILIKSHLEKHSEITQLSSEVERHPDSHSRANDSLKKLLDHQDDEGSTPLLYAAMNNFAEQIKLLFSYGASQNIPSGPMTPLLLAVQKSSYDSLGVLLQWHVKLDAVDRVDGDGLLHHFAKYGDMKTISIFKNLCCIDVEARNNVGHTPLQVFDEERQLHIKDEGELRHHECREAFVQLLGSIRPPSPNHGCWRNGWDEQAESNENNSSFAISPEDENEDDDEIFFDTLEN